MNQSQGGLSCALTMLVKEIEPTPQVFRSGVRASAGGRDDAGEHDRADEREHEGQLVGDHLCGGAQAADEGVFVVRAPARHEDADHVNRAERDIEDDTCRQRRARQIRRERQDDERREHRREEDHRRQPEERVIGRRGAHVLFQQQLPHVQHRLRQPGGAVVQRAIAILRVRLHLAVEVREDRRRAHQEKQREEEGDDEVDNRPDHIC